MLNFSELVVDPDFAQSFTVRRKSGYWERGRFIAYPEQSISFTGVVTPVTGDELEQFPEADRIRGITQFVSQREIRITSETPDEHLSDEIDWDGCMYKVIRVENWSKNGFYNSFAVKLE